MSDTPFIKMRRVLSDRDNRPPVWPAGVVLEPFDPPRHALEARTLLNAAYADGGGQTATFEDWWPALQSDTEYDPALCFPVRAAEGTGLIAFAQCWTCAFVKDIAIAQDWRRQGVGGTLLDHVFHIFCRRGAAQVELKVAANNPHGAVAFYRAMGMTVVETL